MNRIAHADLNLHFNCRASDGLVKGYARIDAYIHGDAVRIGERISLASGNSEFSLTIERYDIRVTDITRIVGKECIFICNCTVTISNRCYWTGKLEDEMRMSMDQIVQNWNYLKGERWWIPWDPEKMEGHRIQDMKLIKHPNKKPCAYCTDKAIKEREIYSNYDTWAFPTNIPIVPGHVLIAPKRCVSRIRDLTVQEWAGIKDLADRIMPALRIAYGAEGFNMCWNDGIMAGQNVPHLHLHVIPRRNGDTGLLGYDPRSFLYRTGDREPLPEPELHEIRDEIQRAL